ncbi:poly-gamma-glutamate biosynthesis protein [Micromonospora qiuiae]|uniref:Poly-gamma-glutamate biosynthesis protein n=1 Tax=Micromonospora qiuiae TaxID=502268 RepID=A0ABQ4JKT2_9ACTN|nr:CapA family protein [Micromonospora qiuiae]GIJ30162.1 poly-gamma-glutamate biosynthesis protein [Micromonospora qiuiae]
MNGRGNSLGKKLGAAGVLLIVGLVAACDPPTNKTPHQPPAPQASAGPRTLTVVAAGDLLVHPELSEQAAADARQAGRAGHDFTQVLAAVRPRVSAADLAICHMETPLAPPEGPFTGWPYFSVPPQLADAAAWAGFDTCSTASNHSLDTGVEGIARTLDNLDRVGLRHTGTARNQVEARLPNVLEIKGVRIGHLSYTVSFNGIPLPQGRPWAANMVDEKAILAEASRTRAAGAEINILSMHWGTEYQSEPNAEQIDLARRLLASPDIDLIVGHHVHVVQPFEKIDGKWVAYGMGNLTTRFADGSPENTQDAVVPEFTFTRTPSGRWEVTAVSVLPTWMQYHPAARVVDLTAGVNDPTVPAEQRAQFAAAWKRITAIVNERGAGSAGLRIPE